MTMQTQVAVVARGWGWGSQTTANEFLSGMMNVLKLITDSKHQEDAKKQWWILWFVNYILSICR